MTQRNLISTGKDINFRRQICIVVVNWNGWQDTICCLSSLFTLEDNYIQVVVCDNGSNNDSFAHLSEWLLQKAEADKQNYAGLGEELHAINFKGNFSPFLKSVYLLKFSENFGYAGAINRCVAWGQKILGAHDFWLLNNDVKVEPQTLAKLVAATCSAPNIGLCGSVLLDWDDRRSIQAIGGIYSRPLAVGWHLKDVFSGAAPQQDIYFDIDYPVGASLFVTQEYLAAVGLMDESYFLYYEEMDWVERGRLHGFRPAVALNSLVQHKEGASTGSHGGVRNKSLLSERYGVINRLRITRKFWPFYLPVVWGTLWFVVLNRLVHAEWARAGLVLRIMFKPQLWIRDKSA